MKKSLLRYLYAYLALFLIAVLLAFNYHLFIVKNDFAPAGLNGIATMIQYKTGFSIGYMSLIINVPLCVLAYFLVDKRFAARSLFFCLVYSFSYLALQKLGLSAFQSLSRADLCRGLRIPIGRVLIGISVVAFVVFGSA